MPISNKSKQLTNNYISQKLADPEDKLNKVTKMKNAGYSIITATKNNIEDGSYYTQMTSAILNKTGTGITLLIDHITERMEEGELEKYSIPDQVKMLKTMVQIGASLSPSFTTKQKTESEVDGQKTSVWRVLKTGGN